MTFLTLIVIPIVVALIAFTFPERTTLVKRASIYGSITFFGVAALHAWWVALVPMHTLQIAPWFQFDALNAGMTLLVAWVFVSAMLVSDEYLTHELHAGHTTTRRIGQYIGFAHLFALAMVLTLSADHMLFMWLALEASTLTSALLVAHSRKKSSLEAAWKYVVLCSLGLLFGLLGILAFFVSFVGTEDALLRFSHFASLAEKPAFDLNILKVAFILLCAGIGTKVGLVPVQNWLPDAHGETPAPISAMLSGVLLSVALLTVLRFKQIIDALTGDASWTNHIFISFGVLSILYASLLILHQRNYKRLLAYSSIEHMGLAMFGFALGPVGIAAGMLHILGHALLKPALFFSTGNILHTYHTAEIRGVRGLTRRLPHTATLFLYGVLGLLAMPPSLLFLSELTMLVQGARVALVATMFVSVGLVIASYGMLRGYFDMVNEKSDAHPDEAHPHESLTGTHLVVGMQIFLLVVLSGIVLTDDGRAVLSAILASITPTV